MEVIVVCKPQHQWSTCGVLWRAESDIIRKEVLYNYVDSPPLLVGLGGQPGLGTRGATRGKPRNPKRPANLKYFLHFSYYVLRTATRDLSNLPPSTLVFMIWSTAKMPLELREVKSDDEWNELIQCECESYEDPFNAIYILLRPDRGNSPKAREGFKELRDRQLAWHKNDPTSRWFKVVDTDLGDKVIGGANWNTFTENPYPKALDHPLEGTWWPEGAND